MDEHPLAIAATNKAINADLPALEFNMQSILA